MYSVRHISEFPMKSEFLVCDASRSAERERWLSCWSEWPDREVFAHPSYVELFAQAGQSARCAILVSRHGSVIYPFIHRDLMVEPYWSQLGEVGADIVTPYGYGGPYCWRVRNLNELADEFWAAFTAWGNRENIVSEFIRFSLFDEHLLPYPGQREPRLRNVVRTLGLDTDALWRDYKHKVRKNVNRAQEEGIRVEIDENGNLLDQFVDIYYRTMERRSASETYFFSRSFFKQMCETLSGRYAFFHAFLGDEIVSTEIVLISEHNVYSFLGGTNAQHFDLRPNDLLKHHIILWSMGRKKINFVLGGGYQDGDGIFKYKQSFAPDGVRVFHVGKRILNAQMYDRLVQTSKQLHGEAIWPKADYFPEYRA